MLLPVSSVLLGSGQNTRDRISIKTDNMIIDKKYWALGDHQWKIRQ